jgi:WD40 repeat protein/uncharacterized caspase-like protein
MVDTGGHVGAVNAIEFTISGKFLVSAGDDKVARVWSWRDGRIMLTVRGQSGSGSEGKISALAISPDDRWLAVGGWFDADDAAEPCCGDIRLYEISSGKLIAVLRGHANSVNALAFSPDGRLLLSGSSDKTAVIWDIAANSQLHVLKGRHARYVSAVAFSSGGSIAVTAAADGLIQFWRVSDGHPIGAAFGHATGVTALATSAEAGLIASGSAEGEIRIWDRDNGALKRTLKKLPGTVLALKFTPDGLRLISSCACVDHTVRIWDPTTGKQMGKYAGHDNAVLAIAVHPEGELVASAGGANHEIHIWDLRTSNRRSLLRGVGRSVWAVGVSRSGNDIAWGSKDACPKSISCPNALGQLQWTLRLPTRNRTLGEPEVLKEAVGRGFLRARSLHGAWTLLSRNDVRTNRPDAVLEVREDGRATASIRRDSMSGLKHSAFSFTPDGDFIVSGGAAGMLAIYDKSGRDLGEFVGHTSQIWAIAISEDNRLLVSGSLDQTVRLWNVQTRELISSLFHDSDGDWIMWTPQGYYTGSPGADRIVGWQVNRGRDKEAEYVRADQLGRHLNRPDIVERAIILASAEQAVQEAPGTSFNLADLVALPVPQFRLVAPQAGSNVNGERVGVMIAIESTPDPVKSIQVQVNGRQVEKDTPDVGSGGFGAGERLLDVPLSRGRNEARITLANAIGENTKTLALTHEGDGALDKRGTLYALAIGVDKYPALGNHCGDDNNASCDLNFSGADARALVEAVERRLGPDHDKVIKRVLINGSAPEDDPTATNILDALDLLKRAQETDTVLLFISGHGSNDGPDYRFLATNAEWVNGYLRGSTVVQWQVLQAAVEGAKGRRILFIDTCHAGNAYNQRLGNSSYHANIIAYMAARFDQEALEDNKLGHGLFTYALVEGLEGKGGFEVKRQISTNELADYVIKRVGELAKAQNKEQRPQYLKGRDAEDYILTRW